MMDFQGLASKVKAAASKINFDQMAANDDYIHSDDLNVKGRNTNRRKSNPEATDAATSSSSTTTLTSSREPTEANVTREATSATRHQPQQQQREWTSSSLPAASNRTHNSDDLKTSSSHAPLAERRSNNTPMLRQSTMPLLSVVANTLAQAHQHQTQSISSKVKAPTTTTTNAKVEVSALRNSNNRIQNRVHDSDSEEDDGDDDDDAILNLLREKNAKVAPKPNVIKPTMIDASEMNLGLQKKKKKNPNRFLDDFDPTEQLSDQSSSSQHQQQQQQQQKKKNHKRFLEDLDQRLSTPLDIEAGSTASTTTSTTAEYEGDTEPYDDNNNNNQWSWIRNAVASSRINVLLGQPLPLFKEPDKSAPPTRKGPLSRREFAPLLQNNEEDDVPVVVVHSSSVLGAAEQAELARLSHRSSTASSDFVSAIMDMFKQNPTHSMFLVFTLLLALAVYFYSRNRSITSGL